jgi:hypothetical protein
MNVSLDRMEDRDLSIMETVFTLPKNTSGASACTCV